jgi:hypothetical protein
VEIVHSIIILSAILGGVLVFFLRIEHRLTVLETELDKANKAIEKCQQA